MAGAGVEIELIEPFQIANAFERLVLEAKAENAYWPADVPGSVVPRAGGEHARGEGCH